MGTREFIKSGFWFAVAGAIPGLCLIFVTWAQDQSPAAQIPPNIYTLWVFAPAVIAGAGGMTFGADILDRTIVDTPLRAVQVGIRVACISFALYVPILAAVTWVGDGRGSPQLLLIWVLLYLMFGAMSVGWLVVTVGAAAGWLLYRTRPDADAGDDSQVIGNDL